MAVDGGIRASIAANLKASSTSGSSVWQVTVLVGEGGVGVSAIEFGNRTGKNTDAASNGGERIMQAKNNTNGQHPNA